MFRATYPIAWAFHHNTQLWPYQRGDGVLTWSTSPPFKEYNGNNLVSLPRAASLKSALSELLEGRLSCRRFQDRPLSLLELATVLHAGYGVQGAVLLDEQEMLIRSVPSGGGLYPLEVYLLVRNVRDLTPGIYHYAVLDHALEQLDSQDVPAMRLAELFIGQSYAAEAAVIAVLTAVLERSLHKYADRGYRLILLEAGHTMQNLNLASGALGLASVNLGGFFDADLAELLALETDQEVPLYATAIGVPRLLDSGALRKP